VTRYRFALISQELEQMSIVLVCLLVSGELHAELDEPDGKIELRTRGDSTALDQFVHRSPERICSGNSNELGCVFVFAGLRRATLCAVN
jgi:hypothetical protein